MRPRPVARQRTLIMASPESDATPSQPLGSPRPELDGKNPGVALLAGRAGTNLGIAAPSRGLPSLHDRSLHARERARTRSQPRRPARLARARSPVRPVDPALLPCTRRAVVRCGGRAPERALGPRARRRAL